MTPTNALARLIDSVRSANDWSDEDVAERARKKGHRIGKSTISDIRVRGVTTIVPAKMRAIADGLGVPTDEVIRAALETVGIPIGSPELPLEQAIQRDPDLPLFAKRQMIMTVELARRDAEDIAAWATEEQAKADARLASHNKTTNPKRRRPSRNAVSDGDDTTTDGKGAKQRGA